MSIHHSFDIEHAQAFGLPEAILISNLQFWICKNAANGVHQHDGRTWTYNSAKAFSLLFPYLSDRQVRRTIDSLEAQAVVMKGNYNTSACDRTLWLAFVDEEAFFITKKPAPKSANGSPKKAKHEPIPANGCAGIGESLTGTDVNQIENSAGEPAAPAKPVRVPRGEKILKTYLAECAKREVKAIPDNHPVRAYCRDAGITPEMASIAWVRFKEEHTEGTRKSKSSGDWPALFASSVKDRWYKLWNAQSTGEATWTTEGLQARRVVEAQQQEEVAA